MSIPCSSIAPSLNLVMAQRLVRRVCKKCKQEITPSPEIIAKIKKALVNLGGDIKPDINSKIKIMGSSGCSLCNNSGYKGRLGIFEVFSVLEEMQKLILSSPNSQQIKDLAIANNMTTMYQDGILKALAGITTIEEVERVASE